MTIPESRKKKPTPARTRPERTLAGALRARDPSSTSARDVHGFAPLIERTIRTGYDLVDEYMQAGRAVAQKLQPSRPAKPEQDGSRDRMAEYITHLAFGALEYVQALSRTEAQPAPTGVAPPFSATAPSHANGGNGPAERSRNAPAAVSVPPTQRRVQVSVEASTRVRVTLELAPDIRLGTLEAHAARRARAGKGSSVEPGIAVQIRTTPKLTVAHVRVASKVAKGQYSSRLVRVDDNLPCGQLNIEVLAGKRP